jgi:hypothetical protein
MIMHHASHHGGRMPDRDTISEQIMQALREHGLAAAIGVWFSLIAGLAAAVTRKAFTNEALLHKLEQELEAERLRIEKRRDEDRRRLGPVEVSRPEKQLDEDERPGQRGDEDGPHVQEEKRRELGRRGVQ